MKITEFIKNEISGWKNIEIILLGIAFFLIAVNSVFLNDNIIAIISAICGILYTIIAGKGKISCYLFGVCGSACYGYLSFSNALYGNLLLYICYYIPAQVIGFFSWKKHLKKASQEIIKTSLNFRQKITVITISVIGIVITYLILSYFRDSNPLLDSITTFLSIIGMCLTVKRCIEQWIIWMIVNGLSFIMWLNLIIHGQKAYSTLVMWGIYVILAVYFYIEWRKELALNNRQGEKS